MCDNDELNNLKKNLEETTITLQNTEKELRFLQEKINLLKKKQRKILKNIDNKYSKKINVNITIDFD
jgi:hypothetical protein